MLFERCNYYFQAVASAIDRLRIIVLEVYAIFSPQNVHTSASSLPHELNLISNIEISTHSELFLEAKFSRQNIYFKHLLLQQALQTQYICNEFVNFNVL